MEFSNIAQNSKMNKYVFTVELRSIVCILYTVHSSTLRTSYLVACMYTSDSRILIYIKHLNENFELTEYC